MPAYSNPENMPPCYQSFGNCLPTQSLLKCSGNGPWGCALSVRERAAWSRPRRTSKASGLSGSMCQKTTRFFSQGWSFSLPWTSGVCAPLGTISFPSRPSALSTSQWCTQQSPKSGGRRPMPSTFGAVATAKISPPLALPKGSTGIPGARCTPTPSAEARVATSSITS